MSIESLYRWRNETKIFKMYSFSGFHLIEKSFRLLNGERNFKFKKIDFALRKFWCEIHSHYTVHAGMISAMINRSNIQIINS